MKIQKAIICKYLQAISKCVQLCACVQICSKYVQIYVKCVQKKCANPFKNSSQSWSRQPILGSWDRVALSRSPPLGPASRTVLARRAGRPYRSGLDCTGGQHPYLDGSRLCHNILKLEISKIFFWKDLEKQKKRFDWCKKTIKSFDFIFIWVSLNQYQSFLRQISITIKLITKRIK